MVVSEHTLRAEMHWLHSELLRTLYTPGVDQSERREHIMGKLSEKTAQLQRIVLQQLSCEQDMGDDVQMSQ